MFAFALLRRNTRFPASKSSRFMRRPLLYDQAAPVNGTRLPCVSKRSPLFLLAPEVKLSEGMNDRYAVRTEAELERVAPAACTVVGEFRCASRTASVREIGRATESAPA